MNRLGLLVGLLFLLCPQLALPCTIVSGKTPDGVTWAGNNEDFFFFFDTILNVLPPEGDLLGAVSFTYGPDAFIQGGFNEKGLFFDFNALPAVPEAERKDWGTRKPFPGKANDFIAHILRRCATVPEVIDFVEHNENAEFTEAMVGGQMHLADSAGNLAILSSSGFRKADKDYQVSTNFNVVPPTTDICKQDCWRYPIADSLFRGRGVSRETITDILDTTQQPEGVGTIYSNVINLNTGDAYNYYSGDFQNVAHFNIHELLKQGKRTILWRSLFPQVPLVRIWQTYLTEGVPAALALFRTLAEGMTPRRQSETLRHLFSTCLFATDKYADAKVFFDAWVEESGGKYTVTDYYHAYIQLTNGNREQALALFKKHLKREPKRAQRHVDRLEGKKDPKANWHIELKGHKEAKFVAIFGLDVVSIGNYLIKTKDGWAGDFTLSPGKHHYAFHVDGEIVLDPNNPKVEEEEFVEGRHKVNVIEMK